MFIVITKKKPKQERKEEIVAAAIKKFIEKGYEDTTMEGIAKAANLSKGALYHHFEGKDQVLVFAGEKLSEPILPVFYKASQATTPARGLNTFISDYLN